MKEKKSEAFQFEGRIVLSFLPQFLPFASRNATDTQDTHFYNIFNYKM